MKVELEWHMAGRILPELGRRVFFNAKLPAIYEVTLFDEFHIGELGVHDDRSGKRHVFFSDQNVDRDGNRMEFEVASVWCWAYMPEVPT